MYKKFTVTNFVGDNFGLACGIFREFSGTPHAATSATEHEYSAERQYPMQDFSYYIALNGREAYYCETLNDAQLMAIAFRHTHPSFLVEIFTVGDNKLVAQ